MSAAGTGAGTGARGFVGRHVVRELLGRGREVRALVRSAPKGAAVLPVGTKLATALILAAALTG